MLAHQHRFRRLPGLILLFVGLLYLGGTAADPLVHAISGSSHGAAAVQVASSDDGSPGSGLPVSHGEADCLLCKIAGPIVLAAPRSPTLVGARSVSRPLPPRSLDRAPPSDTLSQPRAPPHA
jgi:hypothetical protein